MLGPWLLRRLRSPPMVMHRKASTRSLFACALIMTNGPLRSPEGTVNDITQRDFHHLMQRFINLSGFYRIQASLQTNMSALHCKIQYQVVRIVLSVVRSASEMALDTQIYAYRAGFTSQRWLTRTSASPVKHQVNLHLRRKFVSCMDLKSPGQCFSSPLVVETLIYHTIPSILPVKDLVELSHHTNCGMAGGFW
jgi:hypothetical protein